MAYSVTNNLVSRQRARWLAKQVFPPINLTAVRISAIYAALGFAALVVSDVIFVDLFSTPFLPQVQALKGAIEVLLTAGLIFLLVQRSRAQVDRISEKRQRSQHELQLLHRVFRHNLRNDLTVIRGYADLASGDDGRVPATEAYDRIIETTDKIENYTSQASRIRKVSEHDDRITVALAHDLPNIVDSHPDLTSSVRVTTDIPASLMIKVNPMFHAAITELLTNAVEYNDSAESAVCITVKPETGPNHLVEVCVSDNGPGIPPIEIAAIEGETDQLIHSRGMGLWFVKWVALHSDGYLEIRNPEDGGTAVSMFLPRTLDLSPW